MLIGEQNSVYLIRGGARAPESAPREQNKGVFREEKSSIRIWLLQVTPI
jgi:hypothetical protein